MKFKEGDLVVCTTDSYGLLEVGERYLVEKAHPNCGWIMISGKWYATFRFKKAEPALTTEVSLSPENDLERAHQRLEEVMTSLRAYQKRACELGDECGRLGTELKEAHAEIGRLHQELRKK